ncbi:hypothetical protein BJ170DRAFT_683006 [Xylariales sp. AK1849]|nr:hypothetical protein BJ170DRAFT_683006 [Xylariales sp. AK1849]
MEAWKFVNYSRYSPVYALSITAERWGLEPLPGNLVATEGYWDSATQVNSTGESVWTLPYSCGADPRDFFSNSYNDADDLDVLSNKTRSLLPSDTICARPDPCSKSGCLILIEGIGSSTVGPANSDIVGLGYGLTFLFTLIVILLVMGCTSSRERYYEDESPPLTPRIVPGPLATMDSTVTDYYNPPPRPQQLYAEQALRRDNSRDEVVRCATLLRQLYNLDLQIWGLESCIAEEVPRRREYCRQANELFAQVKEMIRAWPREANFGWDREERAQIDEIRKAVDQYPGKRYDASSQIVKRPESGPRQASDERVATRIS